MNGLPLETSSADLINQIENYTQSIIDKLPPELKETNFAFDIAYLSMGNQMKYIGDQFTVGTLI